MARRRAHASGTEASMAALTGEGLPILSTELPWDHLLRYIAAAEAFLRWLAMAHEGLLRIRSAPHPSGRVYRNVFVVSMRTLLLRLHEVNG